MFWLNDNLEVPPCLKETGNDRALSWFHPRAREPIAVMWDLVAVLREHGQYVSLLTAKDPGLILYRDGWQVVAKPRRKPKASRTISTRQRGRKCYRSC